MNKVSVIGARSLLILGCAVATGCSGADGASEADPVGPFEAPPVGSRLFTLMPAEYTGVDFDNRLAETRELNVFTYRNFYNGGGVALGDLTDDGLPELLLTSNMDGPRLYLNGGELRFRDVTRAAAVEGTGAWATGVTLADVNGDGLLDIYVCYAGMVESDRRANELYIHRGVNADGVPVFEERAAEYGLADDGYSTHAAFVDYDRDGDLDLYVVNNSPRAVSSFDLRNIRDVRHTSGGDRLYRNEGERFVDVSEAAGIFGSEIAFGLGVAVGDLSGDGWPDLYVSNDFFERDYLYVNQRDGTFRETLDQRMPYISYSSMGLDIADIDNDGRLDLYVTDMLPADARRLKTIASFPSWTEYRAELSHGYHHQFMRNMLHRNNGDGTFSEVGQLAGVARTDWSWSALIADFDQDGYKDLHVTNGMPRDLTDQDYLAVLARDATLNSSLRQGKVDFLGLVESMTSTPVPNYAFRNNGDLTFADVSAEWGLDSKGFSNGAAYGDLDGDGAPDLVVSNLNAPVSIYRNDARSLLGNHYLQVALEGEEPNRWAVGAAVTLMAGQRRLHQELMPSRGFQSSVDYLLTFGLGQTDTVQSLRVTWPDGRVSVLEDVAADQRVVVRQSTAVTGSELADRRAPTRSRAAARMPVFSNVTDSVRLGFTHEENRFDDFAREPLMPKLLSTEGPPVAVADVNGDGLEDAFIGGAKNQSGRLFVQQRDGRFMDTSQGVFDQDRTSEDVDALFFDADGDGAPDLYVVSGGSEFSDLAPALQDRLYLNDGRGGFRRASGQLPQMSVSAARVAAADFDDDGDLDLFVGGRAVPWRYGLDPVSVLLENDGRGRFTDATARVAPELGRVGMVTDARWQDFDRDGRTDLALVGEWMPITLFRNTGGGLQRVDAPGLENSHGWWNRIAAGDFTGDGHVDFVVGNLGLNSRLRATGTEPLTMHVNDFDRNGFVEQVISEYADGASRPFATRDDLIRAIPSIERRIPSYEDFAGMTTADLFPDPELQGAVLKKVHTFATSLAVNNGDGSFSLSPLPAEAQIAPVYAIHVEDFDGDGNLDVLLAGNFDGVKPEIGRISAGYGLFLHGHGDGGFTAVPARDSGFRVPGQAREIQRIVSPRGPLYLVTRNDAQALVFRSTLRSPPVRTAGSADSFD